MEYYTTQNFLACHQYADHVQIISRWWYVYGIINTLLDIYFFWRIKIQPDVDSDSTEVEIKWLYKNSKNNKSIWQYTESLGIPIAAKTVHREDNTSCISVSKAKLVTPRVKHIKILFLVQVQYNNGLFNNKYEKNTIMLVDMCNKPLLGPITSWSAKCMTGFWFYPPNDLYHFKLMPL